MRIYNFERNAEQDNEKKIIMPSPRKIKVEDENQPTIDLKK